MTVYPNSIDSSLQLPTVAGVTSEATAINALQAAVIAIENELGVVPKSIYSDVTTRLSIIESRLGSGAALTGGSIDINNANLTGTLDILKGGTGLSSIGSVNELLSSNGVNLYYSLLLDANVDSAAAISGTKINPNFGSQSIISSGNIEVTSVILGSVPASTGDVRLPNSSAFKFRDSGDTADIPLIATSNSDVTIGHITSLSTASFRAVDVSMYGSTSASIYNTDGSGYALSVTAAQISLTRPLSVSKLDDASTGTVEDFDIGTNGYIHFTNATGPSVGGFVNSVTSRTLFVTFDSPGIILHESLGSTASYRISTGSGTNISVGAGETLMFIYDATNNRWRPIGLGL